MKTLIDPDFTITDKMRAWADKKVPRVDIDEETEKFVDYWLAHGRKMASWEATWRNWMRRAPKFDGCAYKPITDGYERRAQQRELTDEQRARDLEKWEKDMAKLRLVK